MTWITSGLRGGLAAAIAGAALAAPPPGEPLDPEKAFPVTAHLTPEGIDLAFRIQDGYYLYANRFRVQADAGLAVGPARLPAGEAKDDPFIGPTRILRRSATVQLPFIASPVAGSYRIEVTAQGCAEELVCYAPFVQVVRVVVPRAR